MLQNEVRTSAVSHSADQVIAEYSIDLFKLNVSNNCSFCKGYLENKEKWAV